MNGTWEKEAARLRGELAGLLATLKHNREKVPLDVLKTKYKKGYDTLCAGISRCASDYAKLTVLHGIRIHKSCLEEAVPIINGTIAGSGILKQLAEAAFRHQDMEEFDSHANALRGRSLPAWSLSIWGTWGCTLRRNAWRIQMWHHSSTVQPTTVSGRMESGSHWNFTKLLLHACRKKAHDRQNKIQKGERDERTSD